MIYFSKLHHQDEEVLEVYADGILVATDMGGESRVFTEPRFDPWRDIVIGKANDDRRSDSLPGVELHNITHWAQYHSLLEVSKYYRKPDFHCL